MFSFKSKILCGLLLFVVIRNAVAQKSITKVWIFYLLSLFRTKDVMPSFLNMSSCGWLRKFYASLDNKFWIRSWIWGKYEKLKAWCPRWFSHYLRIHILQLRFTSDAVLIMAGRFILGKVICLSFLLRK